MIVEWFKVSRYRYTRIHNPKRISTEKSVRITIRKSTFLTLIRGVCKFVHNMPFHLRFLIMKNFHKMTFNKRQKLFGIVSKRRKVHFTLDFSSNAWSILHAICNVFVGASEQFFCALTCQKSLLFRTMNKRRQKENWDGIFISIMPEWFM